MLGRPGKKIKLQTVIYWETRQPLTDLPQPHRTSFTTVSLPTISLIARPLQRADDYELTIRGGYVTKIEVQITLV